MFCKDYQEAVSLLERIPPEVIWEYSHQITGKEVTFVDEHAKAVKQQDIA